ncbi:MAG: hypothetical protein AAGJ83_16435 [Planctomycetota bacterium]
MKISRTGNCLSPSRRYQVRWIGITLLFGALTCLAYQFLDSRLIIGALGVCSAFLLWIDFCFLFDKIELHDGYVRLRHAFVVVSVESTQIASITRAKGVGIVFELKNGETISGPDLGNAISTCNVLKAWFKKQAETQKEYV